jgi:AcrR family transcriptional regulator
MAKKTTKKGAGKAAGSRVRDVKAAILEAALALAAGKGWGHVILADVAARAGISLAELAEHVEDKSDILALFGRRVDRETLKAVGEPDPSLTSRERLFEAMMARFDVLSGHRAAVVSILETFLCDPKQLVISLPHLGRSMNWMLEAAGINTGGVKGAVRVAGLSALYLKTLRVWRDDETADLAKVMAALDQDLGRIESFAGRLGL